MAKIGKMVKRLNRQGGDSENVNTGRAESEYEWQKMVTLAIAIKMVKSVKW